MFAFDQWNKRETFTTTATKEAKFSLNLDSPTHIIVHSLMYSFPFRFFLFLLFFRFSFKSCAVHVSIGIVFYTYLPIHIKIGYGLLINHMRFYFAHFILCKWRYVISFIFQASKSAKHWSTNVWNECRTQFDWISHSWFIFFRIPLFFFVLFNMTRNVLIGNSVGRK